MARLLNISVKGPDGVVRTLEEDAALRRKEKKATMTVDRDVAQKLRRLARQRRKRISAMLSDLIAVYRVEFHLVEEED